MFDSILEMVLLKITQLASMIAHHIFEFIRIRKAATLFLLVGIPLLLLNSCSKGEKKFRIGFSQCQSGDEWRKTMLAEMKRELSFHDNVEFIYRDADANSKKQLDQIEELAKLGVDLLIISPNEIQPLATGIEKVFESGIPVVLVDRGINSEKYTAFVGASNFEVGQNAGRYAVSLLKGKGNLIEVMGLSDASPFIDRHKGFTDIISQHPGVVYLKRLDDHSIQYEQQLTATLQNEKNLNLIFAQTDYIAKEIYRICKKTGVENKVKIIGVDGLPADTLGMGMVANHILAATVLYPTGGQEAISTAIKILEHRPYLKENILATSIIDSTNVRIMKLQNDKVVVQQDDIDKRQKKIEEQIAVKENLTNIILVISITLALALAFGGISFYYLKENKKINKKLEVQKNEISAQRNQLIELVEKVKEATDAKFHFFTNISHELRTPLTLILGPLEDSLSSPKLHFTVKDNLIFIKKNALRLLRLINQLMDFRKIEESKMKLRASENNISEFVTEITSSFNELARKKFISFTVINKVGDLSVWFDVTMLDKVFFNLLSNAFKFTFEKGSITVTIDKNPTTNHLVLRVEDTGIGMSQDDADHAFDVFYQGHSSTFKGTGLGLALSKELILLHHGTITVKSKKDSGTIFEINLPLGKSHLESDEILTELPPSLNIDEDIKIFSEEIGVSTENNIIEENNTQKDFSLLLIEDNDQLRSFLKRRLGKQYEIHEAENGELGISLAFDIIPDLIISDIILPGQNGILITEKLKQDIRTSHIPIILLTAKGSIEEQIEGIKSQADAFIVKPFNLEHLEVTIKNLLKNREVLREHFTSELPTESRSNTSSKIDRKFINEFSAIIENNIANEDFSVDVICKEIGISRVQLYRKVKALIGYNVNDYLLMVRMQKAKFLLSKAENTISEVAFQVGFSSQAYFSTVFKSKFGVTPTEYKLGKSL